MSDHPPSFLNLEIVVAAENTQLLRGLDEWLQLGLIDDFRVKHLASKYLTCQLPVVVAEKVKLPRKEKTQISAVKVPAQTNIVTRFWQAFLDELSIRWLLFLGIFLIVISSGVLAASQWRNFPAIAQYLILFAYTVSFWGIGTWLGKQDNLNLTSQSLRNIAVLLVPVNFWAMSSFDLISYPLGWVTIAIASLGLSIISYWRYRQRDSWFLALFLGLSYLHLGWEITDFSLWRVYLGIIVVAISSYYFLIFRQINLRITNVLILLSTWCLLLIRAGVIEQKINRLGLAIAIAGWLLATIYLYLQQQVPLTNKKDHPTEQNISIINRTLQPITNLILGIGWVISLGNFLFLQLAGVNLLGWNLAWQRLNIYWRKRDILAIFFIGLQGIYLATELIPNTVRENALSLSVEVTKTTYFPESVFGVTLFPYLLVFVFIASWLYRRQKRELAVFSEVLTLLFGLTLTGLSFPNPTWRALNLLLSCLTVGYVSYIRQPVRKDLIYFSHGLGLLTIGSAILLFFPNQQAIFWGLVCLFLMAIEWIAFLVFKIGNSYSKTWYRSCWYFGLILAPISYYFLLIENPITLSLAWLLTPLILTVIAKSTESSKQRRMAISFSCIALFLAQILLINLPISRNIGLTFAVILMFANFCYLRLTVIARIHIGFILGLVVSLLWGLVTDWNWLIVSAIASFSLYLLREYLVSISQSGRLGVTKKAYKFKLASQYARSADNWALSLVLINLTLLTLAYLGFATRGNSALSIGEVQLIATSILMGVTVFWRYKTQPLALYAIAWLLELTIFGIVLFLDGNSFILAVVNGILALLSLWLVRNKFPEVAQIPLIYALLSIFWRLTSFNAYTGCLTLIAALTGIFVSEQNRNQKLNYLSLAGISIAIYELIVYQMSRSPGGNLADGFTVLSLVAATIAFSYRLLAWLWCKQNRPTIFNLSLDRFIIIAHLHWAIGSMLKIIAASLAIESVNPRFTSVSIIISFLLGSYAIIQGRDKSSKTADWWVYVGLVEIVATCAYSRLIITKLSFFDPLRVILTIAIALLIYQIPWQNLGWRKTPWQRVAIILPTLMALVTAESISYLSLIFTSIFYIRIALSQQNIRWSYISLGFINWIVMRLIWQYHAEFIYYAAITTFSLLYIAQFDPYLQQHHKQRHQLRLTASSFLCIFALFYQDTGIIPSTISIILIIAGLGLRIRAFLFTGTISLIITALYQLVLFINTYTFLKWIVGLVAGIIFIIVAANFESKRDRSKPQQSQNRITNSLKSYLGKLQHWE